MDQAIVSIVLPFRNVEKFLQECLLSIQRQSLKQWELIGVDDGSSDKSREIFKDFAKNDRRLTVLQNKGKGLVHAINYGISHSKCRFIARMDADDLMDPRRLEMQVAFLMKNPHVGLVSCQSRHFPKAMNRKRRGYELYVEWTNHILSFEDHLINRFVDCTFAHPSATFRRYLVSKFGGYQEGCFPEDFELWLRWMNQGVIMEKIPHTLHQWRDHPQRASRNDPRYAQTAFHQVKAKYIKMWLQKEINLIERKIYCWGAGRVARKFAQLLIQKGIEICGYIDPDPKKTGKWILGLPILPLEELPPPQEGFVLILVGARGARKQISDHLINAQFIPGRDFIALS